MIPKRLVPAHNQVVVWTGEVKKVIPHASPRECNLIATARYKKDYCEMGRLLDVILLRETR